ncbi:SMI1/KNR4 family protein [Streptomyces spongiicola]|uniref:SMI1/KNR4 family protein n=1 Tax=Streptomyces spongiicola TaxID=1690221 RepID=UPI0033F36683
MTADIQTTWSLYTDWLRTQAPRTAQVLAAAADDSVVSGLVDELGMSVPTSLETLLRITDGSTGDDAYTRILPGGMDLLSARKISMYRNRYLVIAEEIADDDWWKPQWLPFAQRFEGREGYLLDASNPTCPVLKYTEADYPRMVAPSLAWFIDDLTSLAVNGTSSDDSPFRGYSARIENGAMYWERQ